MDFKFHPFRQTGGGGEAREANGFLGIQRTAGVGQQQKFFWINEFQDVGERIALAGQIGAAEGDGDHFRAAGGKSVAHGFRRRKFSGAHDEPRPENPPGDDQWLAGRRHCIQFRK